MTQPIRIDVGRQHDGATYELHPSSRKRIQERFPQIRAAPTVFVGYETQSQFEEVHGPIWKQIAILLTGLSWEQIEELGGIRIVDSEELRELQMIR